MNFGQALDKLTAGDFVCRKGWNGKGMFLFHVMASEWKVEAFEQLGFEKLPFIAMKTADNRIVPWLASQTDILAEDWEISAGITVA